MEAVGDGLRPKRNICRRLTFAPEVPLKESSKERKRRSNEKFRAKLKANPEVFAAFKADQAVKKRESRKLMTTEQKNDARERTKLRVAAFRARQKEKANTTPTSAVTNGMTTRTEQKKLEDKRERNKLSQKKRRDNMSSQKKRREKEKKRIYYHRTKAQKSSVEPLVDSCQSPKSKSAISSATHRLKRNLPQGSKLLVSLKHLVRSIARSKDKKQELESLGVAYHSPTKNIRQPLYLNSALKSLAKLRDKETLKAKRLLRQTALNVSNKYSTQLFARTHRESSVETFYEQKSLHIPGKIGVTRNLIPKKILDKSISALHLDFLEETDIKVSRATFFRKRPRHILSFTKTPFKQCLCERCLNPMLKFKSINQFLTTPIMRLKDLISLTVCNSNMKCIKRECTDCSVEMLSRLCAEVESVCDQKVSWSRWELTTKGVAKRLELRTKLDSVEVLFKELKNEMQKLPLHDFTHRWQSQQYQQLKADLPEKWAVLTMDFSENYLCRHQDQPQSAYYGYSQVTIHPCVLNYPCLCGCGLVVSNNIIFVSDVLDHSANMVHLITKHVLEVVKEKRLVKLIIFSDGCSSQYKSKLPFFYLSSYSSEFDCKIERCYFGARHGKNPCDALGGVVKQAATRAIQSRQAVIQNASDFFAFAKQNLVREERDPKNNCIKSSRQFHLISSADIPVKGSDDLCTVVGTMTLHSLRPLPNGQLSVRELSCFCSNCKIEMYGSCENKDIVPSWRDPSKISNQRRKLTPTAAPTPLTFHSMLHKLALCKSFIQVLKLCKRFSSLIAPVHFVSRSLMDQKVVVDRIAQTLYPEDAPEGMLPVCVTGDGNCLPRTLSFLIFGDETHHVEFRVRLIVELACNRQQYLSPSVWSLSDDNFLLSIQSGDFYVDSTSYGISQAFEKELLSLTSLGTYMGLWQLMAASQIMKCGIISIYPERGSPEIRDLMNRTIRHENNTCPDNLHVMWSSSCPTEDNWICNHFTPVLPISVTLQNVSDNVLDTAFLSVVEPRIGEFFWLEWEDGNKYIVQVEFVDVKDELVCVNFMHQTSTGEFYWPSKPDKSWEPFTALSLSAQIDSLALVESKSNQRIQLFLPTC